MHAALSLLMTLALGCAQGWQLMMKIPEGANLGGAHSVYNLWASNRTLNEDLDNPMSIQPGLPYKSPVVQQWENMSVSLVKVALYSALTEVGHVVFGAGGTSYNTSQWPYFGQPTNKTSWFDCAHIVHSSWLDLTHQTNPAQCHIYSEGVSTVDHSFFILQQGLASQSDCDNMTGWMTVMEPASQNSAIQCNWFSSGNTPNFLYSAGNQSDLSDAKEASVFAVFVDDCVDRTLCPQGHCWQDPMGECYCNGYKCNEVCASQPCADGLLCVMDPKNDSAYSCITEPVNGDESGIGAGAIAGIVIGILLFVGLIVIGVWFFFKWHNRQDELKSEVTHRAVLARDFMRRSVNRLSGRNHNFPRHHLKEEKPSPTIKGKSEQLSPDSSVVFGETNPAFMCDDDPPTPQPTPPTDRRYTEFPTRPVSQTLNKTVSTNEIELHEKKQAELAPAFPVHAGQAQRRYENVPRPEVVTPHPVDYDRASTIGSLEKASTMSEISDATSTSGYSDYTGDTPANLPPSEMISKDVVLRHGHYRSKARSRPRSRTSTVDPPRTLAPPTMESQINYAMERSRRSISSLSSLSSDATHRSDGTQRSWELTKSDVLRARYENGPGGHGDPSGRVPKFDRVEGLSYNEIKKQLDADMDRREARERKLQLEMEREARYEAKRAANRLRMRQGDSLDSGIDAENASGERHSDGRLEIVRARSADQLDADSAVTFSSREATV